MQVGAVVLLRGGDSVYQIASRFFIRVPAEYFLQSNQKATIALRCFVQVAKQYFLSHSGERESKVYLKPLHLPPGSITSHLPTQSHPLLVKVLAKITAHQ